MASTQSPPALLVRQWRAQQLLEVLSQECPYVDMEAVGHWCGINFRWWDPQQSPTESEFLQLLSQLHHNEVPNIALRVARRTHLDSLGVMGYAMLSRPTLKSGLELCMDLAQRHFSHLRLMMEVVGEHVLLVSHVQPAGAIHQQLLQELWLISAWKYIQEMLPEGLAACASYAQLSYPSPAYHGQYQQLLGCRVSFECSRTVLAIPRQWLGIALQRGSLRSRALYENQVIRLLRLEGRGADVVSKTKRLLLERPTECDYHLDKTAQLMALSARTLRRQLAAAGTSFREVCLQVRMSLAKDYLLNSELTVQEIAFQLGYSHANNFFRAFRGYYDLPPEQMRRQQGG